MSSGKIIRPPVEKIKSGKVFRPDRILIMKGWVQLIFAILFLWLLAMGCWLGFGYIIIVLDEGHTIAQFWGIIGSWWMFVNFWFVAINMVWALPASILWYFYVARIEYSILAESGDVMPEIYVRKGIITVTEKHVPFRTITNISSKAGPLDRLFGIGTVEIQTAGYSGGTQPGKQAEERLEGLHMFESVRDFVLRELRRYTGQYVTGTEVIAPSDQPVPRLDDTLQDEILITLRQIRDKMGPLDEILDLLRKRA
ncbi:MAG: PH domain-containing protein [Candidatus Thorarchaeota archaeon]